jgi:hypothetical protein
MLVGTLGDKALYCLLAVRLVYVTELAGMGAQLDAQLSLRGVHLGEWPSPIHGEAFQCHAGAALGLVASCDYGLL